LRGSSIKSSLTYKSLNLILAKLGGVINSAYHPKQTLQRLQILNLGGYILKVIYHSIAYSTRQKVFVPPAVTVGLL